MNINRKTGIIVGVLYIIGTVSGILSVLLTKGMNNSPESFAYVMSNHKQFTLGAISDLVMGFSLAFIPIILYSILKKQNERMAIGYVVFRSALETVTYIAIFISLILFLRVAQGYTSATKDNTLLQFENISAIILNLNGICMLCLIFVFSIGALLFYTILYQSKLIPRWLSVWGIIAIILHLTTGFLILFNLQTGFSMPNMLMNFPIFLQEMVMAVWLIVKGFNLELMGKIS